MKNMKLTENLAQGAETFSVSANDTSAKTVNSSSTITINFLEGRLANSKEGPVLLYKVLSGNPVEAGNCQKHEDGSYWICRSQNMAFTGNKLYLSLPKNGVRWYNQSYNSRKDALLSEANKLRKMDPSLSLPEAMQAAEFLIEKEQQELQERQ